MNDQYIVFDDIRKEFTKDVTSFLSFNRNGTINCFNGFGDTKYFKDIGLKDINGKSIYADSSIVEFEYKALQTKVKGYFKYSNITLGYHLHLLEGFIGRAFRFDYEYMYNFKIIDTIQENKLGLIK